MIDDAQSASLVCQKKHDPQHDQKSIPSYTL